jgi:tetratricopeptide (TPR) repeat protein
MIVGVKAYMNRFRIAAAVGCAAGATAMIAGGPAAAQPRPAPVQASTGLSFTAAERMALAPLAQAVAARNWAAAAAAVPAAQQAARSADARYVLGRYQLDIGLATRDRQLQYRAIQAILQSGVATPSEQSILFRQLASVYYEAGTPAEAEPLLRRALETSPNDPELYGMLAQVSRDRRNDAQALTFLLRALDLSEAAGRPGRQNQYKVALNLALEAAARPGAQPAQRMAAVDLARRLVLHYPQPGNWRDALLAYRDVTPADPLVAAELARLMHASGALAGERDYLLAARALQAANSAIEAKAILDAGVQANMLDASDRETRDLQTAVNRAAGTQRTGLTAEVTRARAAPTGAPARAAADSLYGAGRFAEAAELYQLALTKTGEDPNLVNLRLGASLARAGRRAEAEAALRLVTGPRAELAGFWLAWLNGRPAA